MANRVWQFGDSEVEAQTGTQMNCGGGIARVRLRFVRIPEKVLGFEVSPELVVQPNDEHIALVPFGCWRDPVEEGLRRVYSGASIDYGIQATLMMVLIHLVDTNPHTSSAAGALALEHWLTIQAK